MAIVATASSGDGTTFEPAPAGVHAATCVDVVDLGIVDVTWKGVTKQQHKVRVAWQIAENREDGKPFMVFRRYTLSLHEKAALRKDLESWRGQAFTAEESRSFDVEPMIGRGCLLNVTHNVVEDKTFANVVGVMPLPKGMTAPEPRDYVRAVDRPDEEEEEAKPETAATAKTASGASERPRWSPPRVYNDDDIPAEPL